MNTRKYLVSAAKTSTAFILSSGILLSASPASAEVAQTPLLLGGGNVPGNLALTPSVEFPTILSYANLGNYSSNTLFTGYFDSEKCYSYNNDTVNADNRDSHFYPDGAASSRVCERPKWSGNFLNWAATQTIDPFRSALTGGYRVKDTPTETWLEKARHTGQGGVAQRQASGTGATPANWGQFNTKIHGLGARMRFAGANYSSALSIPTSGTATEYTSGMELEDDELYEVYIRVKVCDQTAGVEANCKRYAQGYKPDGLIQQYSKDIRFSVFGYLNDSSMLRDGAALRAQQKYVGPTNGRSGTINNAAEWDADGVFIRNPDASDATNTSSVVGSTIADSGVINYLNKFGQMTSQNHKSHDPVSELYYTALRYFKNQGNVSDYSTLTSDAISKFNQADGFPVITNWNDPMQYACQKNVILGIGDVNTHRDKNLPGNSNTTDEPAVPSEVTADTSINVVTATQKVAALEGITLNTPFNAGRQSSAYIVGMAYDANTMDQRSTLTGKQTISTYWVDVRENQVLASKSNNQYWLAAKYGGFKVPSNYGDPYARTTALEESWWRTTTDYLTNDTSYPRPDNFYVASDAAKMVEGLKKAFAQISNEVQSTTASLATNSTRLGTDTAVYQSLLDSRDWSGDLIAKAVDTQGVVSSTASWRAAAKLDALDSSAITSRKIFTNTPPTQSSSTEPLISTTGRDFSWSGLSSTQQDLLKVDASESNTVTQSRLNFLRGDRSNEQTIDNRSNPFRQRGSRFGDIVNSDPQFIHKQDFGYARLSWSDGDVGDAYTAYRSSSTYQNKKPLVIVGANDGMLHGFDATISTNGGSELFAYVPHGVMGNLKELADPEYTHRYSVDGTPRTADFWNGSAWKTMVVGSTGAGGKSIFALDITAPNNMSSSSVMWEFSHPRLGYTLGQPAIVALPSKEFGVIVSSGYHDTAQTDGKVWVLNPNNGSIISEFTLPTTGNLGGVLASDTDYDLVADRLYVADTLGNVWRIDMTANNQDDLQLSVPGTLVSSGNTNPLFIAKDASGNRQPITAPLSSAFDGNKHMIYFGTGSFYKVGDNEIPVNPPVQSFYGITDAGQNINGRASLLEQKITAQSTLSNGNTVRQVTANTIQPSHKGWYLDLAWSVAEGGPGPKGERSVARATLRNDRVIFTTLTPAADPCAYGGSSFIMSLNRSNGARLNYTYFDTNGDGVIDNSDTLSTGNGNIPWSGVSDPDEGVVKGVVSLYRWLCFAGSSGNSPTCVPVSGSQTDGRKSWREIRAN